MRNFQYVCSYVPVIDYDISHDSLLYWNEQTVHKNRINILQYLILTQVSNLNTAFFICFYSIRLHWTGGRTSIFSSHIFITSIISVELLLMLHQDIKFLFSFLQIQTVFCLNQESESRTLVSQNNKQVTKIVNCSRLAFLKFEVEVTLSVIGHPILHCLLS